MTHKIFPSKEVEVCFKEDTSAPVKKVAKNRHFMRCDATYSM